MAETMLITLLMISTVQTIQGYWWLNSQVFAVGYLGGCNTIIGLVKEQKELCREYPSLMEVVGKGAKLGLTECQHQFAKSKWNCSHVDQRQKGLLGLLTSKGNKEAAFFQAITSAGVVVEITRSCNKQKHQKACRCVRTPRDHKSEGFEWTGCNDNVDFGMMFAKQFLDAREVGNDARVLMNKHNNLAGRMAVRRHMRLECTCHGVSGSCNVKTCKYSLPDFYRVGDVLQQTYHKGILVTLDQTRNVLEPKNLRKRQTDSDLVFIEQSPNYCVKNLAEGTLGVAGRRCNKTSHGPDGCDIMCCGMGFNTKEVSVERNCYCKFIWCCKVKCRKCREKQKHYFCRGNRGGKNKRIWVQHDQPNIVNRVDSKEVKKMKKTTDYTNNIENHPER